MTPREIIALATHSHACDGEYSLVGGPSADAAIQALANAGYSIIHDSENHGPTVERIATYLERQSSFGDGKWAARHVRAMTTGVGDAALPDEVRE